LATDWQPYAAQMHTVLNGCPLLEAGVQEETPCQRLKTKFEQRGERLGHSIYDLIYTRIQEFR